jgi:uncharacterized protein (TIGR02145 family)
MRKYYFRVLGLLFLVIGTISCSDQESKTSNELASRPIVPPQNNEVRIGIQVWMTKNLNVSRYRNGDIIPEVQDPTEWANLTTGAWCYNNNNASIGRIYGKLYNWAAVTDPRGLAPIGWHVPTDTEWTTLTTYLGGLSVAGGELKEAGTSHWRAPNAAATNGSRFAGIPGGYRDANGILFFLAGANGYWWTSSESSAVNAINRRILYDSGFAYRSNLYGKGSGFAVRCVRD